MMVIFSSFTFTHFHFAKSKRIPFPHPFPFLQSIPLFFFRLARISARFMPSSPDPDHPPHPPLSPLPADAAIPFPFHLPPGSLIPD
jgi:hypothetical protein